MKLKGRGRERKEGKRGMRRRALTAGDKGAREKENRGGRGVVHETKREWRTCERENTCE